MITRLALSAFFTLSIATVAHAQDTQPAAAAAATTAQAGAQLLSVTVTGVEGNVQVRTASDQPWQKAEVGMELSQDAEFRTGPRSAVRFNLPPDQTVTLDRLGTVKVLTAIEQNGTIQTDLGMKYGRTRYDIEAGGRQHESTIRSPSSTLAVRGTKVSLYDQRPFIPEAVSLTGRAQFRDFRKSVAFGGPGAGKARVTEAQSSAAATALDDAVVDPTIARARTAQEEALVSTLISRGSFVFFDSDAGIDVVTGGVPPTDRELRSILPGELTFVLRWTGNADLNLAVSSPGGTGRAGESVFPIGGLNYARSGGRTTFDHRGGPDGGIEVVSWPSDPPRGFYNMGAIHISGEPAQARFNAYRNGRPINMTDFTNGMVREIRRPIEAGQDPLPVLVPVDTPPPFGNQPQVNVKNLMGPMPRM